MNRQSVKFEMTVHKIHDLIEQPGSEVTWNDYVPDPDNPDQLRQIDITIKREGLLTLVECRIHKKRQDVKWIEELIGRRTSLLADSVIAVSASGFTRGAMKKADAHGIILRDFQTLTKEEIQNWGHKTRLRLTYLQYENVILDFGLMPFHINVLDPTAFKQQAIATPNLIYPLFDGVANEVDSHEKGLLEGERDVYAKFTFPQQTIIAGLLITQLSQ